MKRIITIISVVLYTMICTSLYANDNTNVSITATGEKFTIYASGKGFGETIEDAKLAAYNNMLQQLIAKTHNFDFPSEGSISRYLIEATYSDGTKEFVQGEDVMLAKIYIDGRWELKEGFYIYTLELLVKNLDKTDNE